MASIEKIKRGIARYLDDEFTSKMTGWQKWVFGAGAAMYLENLNSVADQLQKSPLTKGLLLIDEAGDINTEKLRKHFLAEAQKGPITFNAPIVGAVTLDQNDVEKLYRYISE